MIPARARRVPRQPPAWLLALALMTAGPAAAAEPPPEVLAAAAGGRHALAIGIDRFDDDRFPTLRWAEADARAMAAVLVRDDDEGFARAEVVRGEETVRDAMLARLDAFLAPLGPDDTALVYVSSHGVVEFVDGRPRRYVIPRDARADDIRGSAVEVDELLRRLDAARPRWKVLVLATCFGGEGSGLRSIEGFRAEGRRGPSPLYGAGDGPRRATVVMSASYSDGPAWEDAELGHEIYTYFLLEALAGRGGDPVDLDGDGALSAFEAHRHAAAGTIGHTRGSQLPFLNVSAVGERDVVLVGTAASTPRRGALWVDAVGLRSRGLPFDTLHIDGQPLPAHAQATALEPGRHHLELVADGQRSRRWQVHIRQGETVTLETVVARSGDQLLALEGGLLAIPGARGFDGAGGPPSMPAAAPALRLVFEQRLARRIQPLGAQLAIAFGGWPGRPAAGALALPAVHAQLDAGVLLDRRWTAVALGLGPLVGLRHLQARGADAALLAVVGGLELRLRARLHRRLTLRAGVQLAASRVDPFAGAPQFVLLATAGAGLGVEL